MISWSNWRKADDDVDDTSTCVICYNEYESSGERLPRIMPCSHSLCSGCVDIFLKKAKDYVQCPLCKHRHKAQNGTKSFPRNRYILENRSYIQRFLCHHEQELKRYMDGEQKVKQDLSKVLAEKAQASSQFVKQRLKLEEDNLEYIRKLQKSLEDQENLLEQMKLEKTKCEETEQERAKLEEELHEERATFEREREKVKEERDIFQDTSKREKEQYEKCLKEEREKHEATVNQMKPQFESCQKHGREVSMFCQRCEQFICSVCLLKEHTGHEVVDILQEQFEKSQDIFSALGPMAKELRHVKAGLISTKSRLGAKNKNYKGELVKAKQDYLKTIEERFNELIDEHDNHSTETLNEIAAEVDDVEGKLSKLELIQENTSAKKPRAELISRMQELNELKPVVERTASKSRVYSCLIHQLPDLSGDELKALCGNLEKVDTVVGCRGCKSQCAAHGRKIKVRSQKRKKRGRNSIW